MAVLFARPLRVSTRCVAAVLALLPTAVLAQVPPLNDTGMTNCYNTWQATGTTEQPGFEGQDCTRGAAAADLAGVMYKIGGSSTAGRDYSKIANDGSELPNTALQGSGPGDWGCTRDNITGLVWELKTSDGGLRHGNHTYRWYDPDPGNNGGQPGSTGGATCGGTLPDNACNTLAYVQAVNALSGDARLCGASDWRLPSSAELQSLVDSQQTVFPSVDHAWLPGVPANHVWTGQTYPAPPNSARTVDFRLGTALTQMKTVATRIVLVRGGP